MRRRNGCFGCAEQQPERKNQTTNIFVRIAAKSRTARTGLSLHRPYRTACVLCALPRLPHRDDEHAADAVAHPHVRAGQDGRPERHVLARQLSHRTAHRDVLTQVEREQAREVIRRSASEEENSMAVDHIITSPLTAAVKTILFYVGLHQLTLARPFPA
jgi:hypothetical protein